MPYLLRRDIEAAQERGRDRAIKRLKLIFPGLADVVFIMELASKEFEDMAAGEVAVTGERSAGMTFGAKLAETIERVIDIEAGGKGLPPDPKKRGGGGHP